MDRRGPGEQRVRAALHGDAHAAIRRAERGPSARGIRAGGQQPKTANGGEQHGCEIWTEPGRDGRAVVHFVPHVWAAQIAWDSSDGFNANDEAAEEGLVSPVFA